MKTSIKALAIIVMLDFSTIAHHALARGGGGGSGGGGGGGGGFSGGGFSSHSSGSGAGSSDPLSIAVAAGLFILFFAAVVYKIIQQAKAQKARQAEIIAKDNLNWPEFQKEVEQLFYKFEQAWANFDLPALQQVVTDDYYKRMVLELNVLKNEGRANPMSNVNLYSVKIIGEDSDPKSQQSVVVEIYAQADDALMDTVANKKLYWDNQSFTEYWHLVKNGSNWRLNLITQSTEDPALVEQDIAAFAQSHNFYFDPDFGRLMLPNKGVLFSKTNFYNSDINNHVIGYFRDKIVEFYTYIPKPGGQFPSNYLVAQAILPINYKDILIKKKKWLNFAPWGLKKVLLESVDFNNKFCLFADPHDQVSSLELLTPNFMEKIYSLPFELNIEIVGNVLYFYTKDRGPANYQQMLEVLSWAFDEMKM